MAFPFMSTGEPERTATPAAKTQPRPPAQPQVTPRHVRPFSTTKLMPKSASATDLLKIARLKAARTWGEFAFGNGLSSVFDPNNRGVATDMLAYSNPLTGTIAGVNDISRHLYNGNYGNAAGALGMTALSWLPGASVAANVAKGVGKGVGAAAARAGVKGLSTAAAPAAARGMTNTAKTIAATQKGITNTLQNVKIPGAGRPLGPATNPAQGLKSWASPSAYKDWAVQNPFMAAGTMHSFGFNSSGEGQSDVNARLDGEREDMLSQLPNLNY
jgi:hypothetical protein